MAYEDEDHSTCPHTYQSDGGSCLVEKLLADWKQELLSQEAAKVDNPTERDWKAVAEFLMYHMNLEIRGKLMNELPGSYNRILGYEVVKVTRTSDNTRIGKR